MKKNKYVLLILLLSFITSCSETSFIINSAKILGDSDYGDRPSYKVGKPYKINGQWFYPAVDYQYDEVGIASWYGPNFHGKKTANGEIFNQNAVSAAHKTLPIPSIVIVTNLENNKKLEIRINDRGPFVRGRIIDLSKKAAETLGILKSGTAKVRVQINEEKSRKIAMAYDNYEVFVSDAGQSEKVVKKEIKTNVSNNDEQNKTKLKKINDQKKEKISKNEIIKLDKKFNDEKMLIQVGAFSDIRNAKKLLEKLENFKAFIKREFVNERYFYRVRIGPISSQSVAQNILEKLKNNGLQNSKLIIEKLK